MPQDPIEQLPIAIRLTVGQCNRIVKVLGESVIYDEAKPLIEAILTQGAAQVREYEANRQQVSPPGASLGQGTGNPLTPILENGA